LREHGGEGVIPSRRNDEYNFEPYPQRFALLPGRVTLQPTSRWKTFYLTHLAKPASDRLVYRAILHEKISRIVELGIGDGQRALRMIDAAARNADHQDIQYIGLDPFEGQPAANSLGLPLIDAYRLLKKSGAKIKLVPGDPCEGLMRSANSLANIDLLLISALPDAERFAPMWYFVPRMLHAHSLVLMETVAAGGEKTIRLIERSEIDRWASTMHRRKAA
jgi:hypothetical protein